MTANDYLPITVRAARRLMRYGTTGCSSSPGAGAVSQGRAQGHAAAGRGRAPFSQRHVVSHQLLVMSLAQRGMPGHLLVPDGRCRNGRPRLPLLRP